MAEILAKRIASGDYSQGSRLPAERRLAETLQVARNTVRDALDLLEAQGLIQRRAGSGSFVASSLPEDAVSPAVLAAGPLHLHVTRAILEPEIVRLAIISMSPQLIDRMLEVLETLRSATSPADFARSEERLFLLLAEGSGNPLLLACYEIVVKARRQRYLSGLLRRRLTPETMQLIREDHEALVSAVADRDIARALSLVQQALTDEQAQLMQEG